MQNKKYLSEKEKAEIIRHLIKKGYLTKNQIEKLKKRSSL